MVEQITNATNRKKKKARKKLSRKEHKTQIQTFYEYTQRKKTKKNRRI